MSSVSSEDEDIKVRKRLERKEKIENNPIAIESDILEKTGLNASELKELQEIFQLVDLDHSGAISKEELQSLMNTLGLRSNQLEIDNMMSEADPDGTNEIDFESFAKTVSKKVQTNYTAKDLERAFKRFIPIDENDSKLSIKELMDVLTNWGDQEKRLSRDEAMDLLNQISSEKKQLDYFDYMQFISVYFK